VNVKQERERGREGGSEAGGQKCQKTPPQNWHAFLCDKQLPAMTGDMGYEATATAVASE